MENNANPSLKRLSALVAGFLVIGSVHAGAWGTGSFDNDDALDWADDCAKAISLAPLVAAFDAAIRNKYIEAPDGSNAVAAAEVVAAALGKPNPKLPAKLQAWIQRQPIEDLKRLTPQAQTALTRVFDPKASELRQLWSEGKPNKWPEAIAELQSRLGR
jgi:hypothetical protein